MTEQDRTNALLEEQNRLLRKADKRGGCLWNLVMLVLFHWLYLAWLVIKKLALWTVAAIRWVAGDRLGEPALLAVREVVRAGGGVWPWSRRQAVADASRVNSMRDFASPTSTTGPPPTTIVRRALRYQAWEVQRA